MQIVGRFREIYKLEHLLASRKSELVAVYGRRRVGKTFLVREVYRKSMVFEITGLHNGSLKEQLKNFYNRLIEMDHGLISEPQPKDWSEAFKMLQIYLDSLKGKRKKVIFIDEFPWMATMRSNFLMWFENFWNSYCTQRKDLIVVICGSAASYMVKNIIYNKGGLHNRISQRIRLEPFSLHEAKLFLNNKNIHLEHYDLITLYMAVGGVPQYLEMVNKGMSVSQNIDSLCFAKGAELANEFNEVFASLFSSSETHIAMIKALSQTNKGLTRNGLLERCSIKQTGYASKVLWELVESGFVTQYTPFEKRNRGSLFRLTDEFCMFYQKFMESNKNQGNGTWNRLSVKQSFRSWSGFAFESICLKHIQQIKIALGIGGVFSKNSAWENENVQIDLVIDRDDNRINLCEMKFINGLFTIDKLYYQNLRKKIGHFREDTKTRKGVFLTMLTSFGVKQNSYSLSIVENNLTMDCLFGDEVFLE
jgi:hypothetical protein